MYIGVDIGGTKILVASADVSGRAVSQQKISTPDKVDIAMEAIVDLVHAVAKQNDIVAIGVAAPGPIDWEEGTIGKSANLKWRSTNIVKTLEKHFHAPVVLENDADTAGLAEARIGAGVSYDPVLYVGIGTGVGTALISKGQIYRGAYDTEGGHMVIKPGGEKCGCGGHGHWETLVSGPAFEKRFGKKPAELTDTKAWDEYSFDVALGLANLCAAYSPAIVVMGGGLGTHLDQFIKPLQKHLNELYTIYPAPKILPAKFPETASVYGAIISARQSVKSQNA